MEELSDALTRQRQEEQRRALRALLATASDKLSHPQEDSACPPPSPPSLISSSFWSLCGQQLQSLALESGLRLEVHCTCISMYTVQISSKILPFDSFVVPILYVITALHAFLEWKYGVSVLNETVYMYVALDVNREKDKPSLSLVKSLVSQM